MRSTFHGLNGNNNKIEKSEMIMMPMGSIGYMKRSS